MQHHSRFLLLSAASVTAEIHPVSPHACRAVPLVPAGASQLPSILGQGTECQEITS